MRITPATDQVGATTWNCCSSCAPRRVDLSSDGEALLATAKLEAFGAGVEMTTILRMTAYPPFGTVKSDDIEIAATGASRPTADGQDQRQPGTSDRPRRRPACHLGAGPPPHCPAPAKPRIRSAARSAIMIVGALVLPRTTLGITEASTTRRPSNPCTLRSLSTTGPIAQVLVG
jgi:hypothetical protein